MMLLLRFVAMWMEDDFRAILHQRTLWCHRSCVPVLGCDSRRAPKWHLLHTKGLGDDLGPSELNYDTSHSLCLAEIMS